MSQPMFEPRRPEDQTGDKDKKRRESQEKAEKAEREREEKLAKFLRTVEPVEFQASGQPLNPALRELNKPSESEHDWGLGEALKSRNLIGNFDVSSRPGAKDDSDVSYRSLERQDIKKGSDDLKRAFTSDDLKRALTSGEQKKGQKIIQDIMDTIKGQIGEGRKITLQELPEPAQVVVKYWRADRLGQEVPADHYNEAYDKLDSMLKKQNRDDIFKNLKEQNTKEVPGGSNFRFTVDDFAPLTKKLVEMHQASDASKSDLPSDRASLEKTAKDSDASKPKSNREQQEKVSKFFQELWDIFLSKNTDTGTGKQSKEISLEDLPESAQKLIKDWKADGTIDEQAYNNLSDRLKDDDGGMGILADLREKYKKPDAKQNASKT